MCIDWSTGMCIKIKIKHKNSVQFIENLCVHVCAFWKYSRDNQSTTVVTENSLLDRMSWIMFFRGHNVRFCLHHTFIETIATTEKSFTWRLDTYPMPLSGCFQHLFAHAIVRPLYSLFLWQGIGTNSPLIFPFCADLRKITSSPLLSLARIWMWTLCRGASVVLANRKSFMWTAVALSDNFLDSGVSPWLTSHNIFSFFACSWFRSMG